MYPNFEKFTLLHQTETITSFDTDMRKLIDLDEATFKALSKMAIDANTNLKSYIESVLVTHARAGFKDKKPSTKRKSKNEF